MHFRTARGNEFISLTIVCVRTKIHHILLLSFNLQCTCFFWAVWHPYCHTNPSLNPKPSSVLNSDLHPGSLELNRSVLNGNLLLYHRVVFFFFIFMTACPHYLHSAVLLDVEQVKGAAPTGSDCVLSCLGEADCAKCPRNSSVHLEVTFVCVCDWEHVLLICTFFCLVIVLFRQSQCLLVSGFLCAVLGNKEMEYEILNKKSTKRFRKQYICSEVRVQLWYTAYDWEV